MNVSSREYKVTLKPKDFLSVHTLESLCRDLRKAATAIHLGFEGTFDERTDRTIAFLDTRELSLRQAEVVLRERRLNRAGVQYTLKCRSPDRYFAAGTDVSSRKAFLSEEKLEEDIAPPFRSRFSHSTTVTLKQKSNSRGRVSTLGDAEELFPGLRTLIKQKRTSKRTALEPVRNLRVHEIVLTGVALHLHGENAKMALILWLSIQESRPLIAEFSFRYKSKKEKYNRSTVDDAQRFFAKIQQLRWCDLSGTTKTQFAFEEA